MISRCRDHAAFALITHPGSIPGGQVFAWLSVVAWIPLILMVLLFLPMLFPDGRLLSPRWWIVAGSGLIFAVLAFISNGLMPGRVSSVYPSLMNPLGISGARETLGILNDLSIPFGVFALMGMLTSVVVRYRRGDSLLRRQLRGFLLAVGLAIVPFALNDVNPSLSELLVVLLVPLGLIVFSAYLAAHTVGLIAGIALGGAVFLAVALVLAGAVGAFTSTYWTLAYRRLELEALPVTPPG